MLSKEISSLISKYIKSDNHYYIPADIDIYAKNEISRKPEDEFSHVIRSTESLSRITTNFSRQVKYYNAKSHCDNVLYPADWNINFFILDYIDSDPEKDPIIESIDKIIESFYEDLVNIYLKACTLDAVATDNVRLHHMPIELDFSDGYFKTILMNPDAERPNGVGGKTIVNYNGIPNECYYKLCDEFIEHTSLFFKDAIMKVSLNVENRNIYLNYCTEMSLSIPSNLVVLSKPAGMNMFEIPFYGM